MESKGEKIRVLFRGWFEIPQSYLKIIIYILITWQYINL